MITINKLEYQEKLEDDYALAQWKVKQANKWISKRIIGKYFIKTLGKRQSIMNEIFRELREVTRKNYPERFIQSWIFYQGFTKQ